MPENRSSARPRRSRSSVSADEILLAAEEVARGGFDALTMRAVALRMEASPMALYRYFATKDELIDAMLDRVLGRVTLRPATDDWLADLTAFAFDHRQVVAQHPWAIVPLFTHSNPGINGSILGEHALGILARGDVHGAAAVAGFSTILALNYGWFAFSAARDARRAQIDPEATLAADLARLPPDRFPLTISVAEYLSQYGSEEQYGMALQRVVSGIGVAGDS